MLIKIFKSHSNSFLKNLKKTKYFFKTRVGKDCRLVITQKVRGSIKVKKATLFKCVC